MFHTLDRRAFLTASAGGTTALALGWPSGGPAQGRFRHSLKKAVIVGRPTETNLPPIKEAGFDGIEAGLMSPQEAARAREIADTLGLRIHSVLRGWAEFNSPEAAKVEESLKTTVAALEAAQAYGADAVLLVPCRIGGMAIPEPGAFKVEFDTTTGHLTRVVEGDNVLFADYIAAHNHAWDTSKAQIERLIPVAADTGVIIAVENVWNNLWVDPHHFAAFIDSFGSPWVKAYFDIGNHVKYSPPQEWIAILGPRLAKCHVKDFKLNEQGPGGQFVNLREGSVQWPLVRQALDDIGYAGWLTIEGSGELSLEEQSRRLDLIIAGE